MFFVDDVTQTPAHKSINNHEIDLLSLSLSLSQLEFGAPDSEVRLRS